MHGNGVRALPARGARGFACALLAAGLLGLTSCVVLPVRIGPAVEGQVVDQASGKPLAGAIVVVRFDGRYDDVLPDRDLIGHQEAQTDASGRFQMDRIVRPGFSAWPLFKTEARVVGVMHEGYRCAAPRARACHGPRADRAQPRAGCARSTRIVSPGDRRARRGDRLHGRVAHAVRRQRRTRRPTRASDRSSACSRRARCSDSARIAPAR